MLGLQKDTLRAQSAAWTAQWDFVQEAEMLSQSLSQPSPAGSILGMCESKPPSNEHSNVWMYFQKHLQKFQNIIQNKTPKM